MRTPIVVVAYNRPRSLMRLLGSLSKASYAHKDIPLIISIDKAENNQNVLEVATSFNWEYGNKKVVYQNENLGLRRHIIKCGGFSLEYGAVIVLEDDLFVSPNFYVYAEQALEFSSKESAIGGVSLYNHQLNVHTRDNFCTLQDGFDNWYFQFASSWGQAWTKNQWSAFMDWYEKNPEIDNNKEVPAYVRSWSPKSWLKYNIAYLVEKKQYFLYPKISLTTNFSDAGTHVGKDSTIYQVPLDNGHPKDYSFSTIENSQSVYDAYYENIKLCESLNLDQGELCIDLHGYKPFSEKRYLLTSKILDFLVVKSFGKSLKPQDDNIFKQIDGVELFLYDTSKTEKNNNKQYTGRSFAYNYKHISYKTVAKLFYRMTLTKFGNAFKKVFKK